jgi:glycosyltransferase involved in cell wall biosynthesis
LSETIASPPSFRQRFEAANALWGEGRLQEAEEAYLELLKEDASSSSAASRIGDIRLVLGDREGAHDYFSRAIAINPKLPWGHMGLARIAEETGDLQAAVSHYRSALELSSGQSGLAEHISSLIDGIINARQRARSKEEQAEFLRRFEEANQMVIDRQFEEAEAIYRDLLAGDPNNAPLLCKLAGIAVEFGHRAEARACYDRAVAANPNFPWAHIGLSELLEASGEFDAAVDALDVALALDGSLAFALERRQAIRRKRQLEIERIKGVQIRHWPADLPLGRATKRRRKAARPRVAVVAWDLSHNPVGRALALAEVASHHADCEIVGPYFSRYGEDLWGPLRESSRTFDIRGYAAHSFYTFLEGAIRLVAEKPCDVAWISKPRLPSMLIGFLYKLMYGASVLLDIDDDELSFVGAEEPVSLDDFLANCTPSDWREPFGKRWTQLAASLIGFADAVTVCNPVLQQRFGGTLIRHTRNSKPFDAALAKRDSLRAEFGFSDSDKVILFLGTPRRHKGVLEIAQALNVLADPSAVLCVIGTVADPAFKKELEAFRSTRIVFHEDQPFSRVADLNAMADFVCILQDPANAIANYQTPAKLTDALAAGTVVLATPVPPVADLMEPGRIVAVQREDLVDALRRAISGEFGGAEAAAERRAFFRAELATEANAKRAQEAIRAALDKKTPLPEEFFRLLEHIDEHMPGQLPRTCVDAVKGTLQTSPRVGKLQSLNENLNIVMFWKQNDSGIFGRRQDMLLRQFARMPHVDKILHIDAPMSIDQLNALAVSNSGRSFNQGGLIAANTITRHLRASDDDRVKRRSFIYRGKETLFLGRELPDLGSFPNAVEGWLRELEMTDNLLAWVCPVVPGFPDVQKRLGFSFIVADVIDDQRQWPMRLEWRTQIETNYRETFAQADMAFANCQPVSEWLESEGLKNFVVPNGMDVRRDVEKWEMPSELKHLKRPIVGYAGNLSHRIDWDLLDCVAESRPDWSFVIIGAPPGRGPYRQIVSRPNVHALGVLPYETALRYIAHFDAAIIPHAHSALSDSMNPLKLYVYRGLGVPVVSSAVGNLNDLAGDIRIAETAEQFIGHLEDAIAERQSRGRVYPAAELMQAYSWESRAAGILVHMDEVFHAQHLSTSEGIAA